MIIIPIGDIQYTGQRGATAIDTLKRTIEKGNTLGAYYLGMGDYCDFMSPSNRQRLRSAALYDTADDVIEDAALAVTQELYRTILKPTTGRWIGLLQGHHYATLRSGQTTDQKLCEMLKAQFLGTSAVIRLLFIMASTRCQVVLWCHHGVGGGYRAAAPLNKLEDVAAKWHGIDIFIMGHTCKMPSTPINIIEPNWHGNASPNLVHRTVHLVNSGGFARAYRVGSKIGNVPMGDYAEQRMLNPTVLGAPIIKIIPHLRYTRDDRGRQVKMWSPEISVEI